jgi:RNA polymerase sigma-70 factor (ECF subfamily)
MRDASSAQADVDALVRNAQQGESAAFAQLYEQYFDQIYRYVSFKTGRASEAEDIACEVFVRMLESISSFKPQGYPFSAWLFRIAHNLVVDHFRKNAKKKTVTLDNVDVRGEDQSGEMARRLDESMVMEEVYKAMEGLTNLQKDVISLRFAGGLSVAETARIVGKKENAVKALQHAGLKKLRKILDKQSRLSAQPVFQISYLED